MMCSCESDTGYVGPCHGDEPDYDACFHCSEPLDGAACFDAATGVYCSTRCAVAVTTYNHLESCGLDECADGAPLTLPVMCCCYCDGIVTNGDTAHPGCREKLRNGFSLEAGARARAAS
jgi:hypothetical protein